MNPQEIINWLRTGIQGPSKPNREMAADCIEQLRGSLVASQARIAELESQAAIGRRAVEMLREIQTIQDGPGVPDTYVCPSCWRETGRLSKQRHDDDCELAAILRDHAPSNGQAIGGLWQSASADDGMRNIDISDVCGGETDCEQAMPEVDAGALAELLEQAAEDIQEWGAYASAYFQEKHNLAANVAKYREAARRLLKGDTQ